MSEPAGNPESRFFQIYIRKHLQLLQIMTNSLDPAFDCRVRWLEGCAGYWQ